MYFKGVGGTEMKEHEVEMEFFKEIDAEVTFTFYSNFKTVFGKLNFFQPNIFWNQPFFNQNFFRPKYFSDLNFCRPKIFFKYFLHQKFLESNFF